MAVYSRFGKKYFIDNLVYVSYKMKPDMHNLFIAHMFRVDCLFRRVLGVGSRI